MTLITHDEAREKDLQALCAGVLNAGPARYYNPNGADDSTCPFCFGRSYNIDAEMSEIPHESDCVYFIAKDLSTNPKNTTVI